jgi:hypothetical protein
MPRGETTAIVIILAFIVVFVTVWALQMRSAFSDKMLLDNMKNECDAGLTLLQKKLLVVDGGKTMHQVVIGCFSTSSDALPIP